MEYKIYEGKYPEKISLSIFKKVQFEDDISIFKNVWNIPNVPMFKFKIDKNFVPPVGCGITSATEAASVVKAKEYRDIPDIIKATNDPRVEVFIRNEKIDRLKIITNIANKGYLCSLLVKDDFHVFIDVDESVLAYCLLTGRIKNGFLEGPFRFGRLKKSLVLIPEGSELDAHIRETERRYALKPIKTKDLEVGNFYSHPSGELALFLGWVNTCKLNSSTNRKEFGKHETNFSEYHVKKYEFATLWFKCIKPYIHSDREKTCIASENHFDACIEQFKRGYKMKLWELSSRGFHIKKRINFIEKIEGMHVPGTVEKIWTIKNQYVKTLRESKIQQLPSQAVERASLFANMTLFGIEPEVHECFDEIKHKITVV